MEVVAEVRDCLESIRHSRCLVHAVHRRLDVCLEISAKGTLPPWGRGGVGRCFHLGFYLHDGDLRYMGVEDDLGHSQRLDMSSMCAKCDLLRRSSGLTDGTREALQAYVEGIELER